MKAPQVTRPTSTTVQGAAYDTDNFGTEVAAITFSHAGKVYVINRHGKSNIRGYYSRVKRTYTLTNGRERFVRMDAHTVNILHYTLTYEV